MMIPFMKDNERQNRLCFLFYSIIIAMHINYRLAAVDNLIDCKSNSQYTYAEGEWVRYENEQLKNLTKSFYCCDSRIPSLNDFEVCENEPVAVKKTFFQGNSLYSVSTSAHSCVCDYQFGIRKVHDREKYYWKPSNCRLKEWNGPYFCSLLKNKTIHMIGDSTMEQSAATIMSMVTVSGGNCSSQLIFSRSDALFDPNGNHIPFDSLVLQYKPDVVILTVGAWCHSIDEFNRTINSVEDMIKKLNLNPELNKKVYYIWKTQNPGHRSCNHLNHPISKGEEEMLELSSRPTAYEWHLHRTFDQLAKEMAKRINMQIIDMSPLYYRPDGHPADLTHEWFTTGMDCLHYCMPGPLDLFSRIVLQTLFNQDI